MFTTPIQNVVATAASTAFPPSFRISTPIFEHSTFSLDTAPCLALIRYAGFLRLWSAFSMPVEKKWGMICRLPENVTATVTIRRNKTSSLSASQTRLLRRRSSLIKVRFSRCPGRSVFPGSILDQEETIDGIKSAEADSEQGGWRSGQGGDGNQARNRSRVSETPEHTLILVTAEKCKLSLRHGAWCFNKVSV
jgi:hypothetical protein